MPTQLSAPGEKQLRAPSVNYDVARLLKHAIHIHEDHVHQRFFLEGGRSFHRLLCHLEGVYPPVGGSEKPLDFFQRQLVIGPSTIMSQA